MSNNIQIVGKVAKFNKNIKPSKAYLMMENIKIPKNKIWYILIQQQDDELSMVKYNNVCGVDLYKYVNQLKEYYSLKYNNNPEILEGINNLEVVGEEKYSIIKNISKITIDDVPFITKITQDLLKILSN